MSNQDCIASLPFMRELAEALPSEQKTRLLTGLLRTAALAGTKYLSLSNLPQSWFVHLLAVLRVERVSFGHYSTDGNAQYAQIHGGADSTFMDMHVSASTHEIAGPGIPEDYEGDAWVLSGPCPKCGELEAFVSRDRESAVLLATEYGVTVSS